jgi:hypothetical protein
VRLSSGAPVFFFFGGFRDQVRSPTFGVSQRQIPEPKRIRKYEHMIFTPRKRIRDIKCNLGREKSSWEGQADGRKSIFSRSEHGNGAKIREKGV